MIDQKVVTMTPTEAADYLQTSIHYLKYLRTKQAKAENRVGPTFLTIENYRTVANQSRVKYTKSALDEWLKLYRKQPKVTVSS